MARCLCERVKIAGPSQPHSLSTLRDFTGLTDVTSLAGESSGGWGRKSKELQRPC